MVGTAFEEIVVFYSINMIFFDKKTALLWLMTVLAVSGRTFAQDQGNLNKNYWEASFGFEGLAFYSSKENSISVSPFESLRSNFGAAATFGKWITPTWGVRLKGSGYWGKSVVDNTSNNNIKFYAIQAQGMLNLLDFILKGKGSNHRSYDVIPYIGLGLVRNCTYNSNSLGYGFGINNTLKIGKQMKLHCDVGLSFAGKKNERFPEQTAKFHWISADIGLTFNLGKLKKNFNKDDIIAYKYDMDEMNMINSVKKNDTIFHAVNRQEVPSGMTLIHRGHIRIGMEKDSLWGNRMPMRDISVDDFWMDRTEVTNAQYHEFIQDIVDSIVAQRMMDPYFHGDRTLALESLYKTNPITGERKIDTKQLVYVYEKYDYIAAALRQNRLDPEERILNTDYSISSNEEVLISKDTAYIDNDGRIVQERITRPLSSPYDFLNTYIVNVYPDTTCWINDFPKSDNSMYLKYYFSHPDYRDYPVVGVTWEQANAFCAWKTERLRSQLGGDLGYEQEYRLPTEAEWEYAARGKDKNLFPWEQEFSGNGMHLRFANFQPREGNYTVDGNIITAQVGIFPANSSGLYDMAGNVAEWTSTAYTDAGIEGMNNINPQHEYNASKSDKYELKRKSVRGGSWKDSEDHIMSAWRSCEFQNQPRCYIGFRCVRSIASKKSEKTIILNDK